MRFITKEEQIAKKALEKYDIKAWTAIEQLKNTEGLLPKWAPLELEYCFATMFVEGFKSGMAFQKETKKAK